MPGVCFTKTKIEFKLDPTMSGHLCHWLLSPLVSQLWSLYNIFSFNNEISKKLNSEDSWPQFVSPSRNQCQEWLEELVAWMACHSWFQLKVYLSLCETLPWYHHGAVVPAVTRSSIALLSNRELAQQHHNYLWQDINLYLPLSNQVLNGYR